MPAVRLGRHIGAVRFDQNAVERQSRDGLDRAAGVFEGHDTREAQIPAALGKPKRHFRRAGEAVEHAARVGVPPDDVHGVAVRLALVDDDREPQRLGQLKLLLKGNDLPRARQIIAFEQQLELAEALRLPVIVHEREAHGDAMDIVRRHPDACGVFHCFSGSAEMALWLAERGWYLGFTGVVTFKNARRAVEAVAALPLDRILIETDCPYMAPEPHRGHRNDSRLVPLVADRIAAIRGLDPHTVETATTENAKRLFRIP